MIKKEFDEMTGKGQLTTQEFTVFEKRATWTEPSEYMKLMGAVVFPEQGQPVTWLVFTSSKNGDWRFLNNTTVFTLLDGVRRPFEGFIGDTDTQSSSSGHTFMCIEQMHVQIEFEWLSTLVDSNDAKIRAGDIEIEISAEIKRHLASLVAEAEDHVAN